MISFKRLSDSTSSLHGQTVKGNGGFYEILRLYSFMKQSDCTVSGDCQTVQSHVMIWKIHPEEYLKILIQINNLISQIYLS